MNYNPVTSCLYRYAHTGWRSTPRLDLPRAGASSCLEVSAMWFTEEEDVD